MGGQHCFGNGVDVRCGKCTDFNLCKENDSILKNLFINLFTLSNVFVHKITGKLSKDQLLWHCQLMSIPVNLFRMSAADVIC